MALDYAMNADFRRIPDPDDPEDVATIARALTIYDEAILASERVDGDTGLPVDTARVQGATLIRCAEAAVDYHEDARGALAAYFREDPPRDQYYVRALFIQALLRSREALKYNGLIRLTITKEAIQFLLQAITIAEEFAIMISGNPSSNDTSAYGFLIYNASVHHYAIVRSLLLRDGARIHAIPSLTRFIEALQKSDDPDIRWRARNILTLATCHAEIGELDKAINLTTQALDLYGKLSTPVVSGSSDYQLIEEAVRLRSHFTSLTDMNAAVEGTGKATILPPAIFPGASKTDDNLRMKILQQLQPMLTGSAVAFNSTGYSYNIGRGPHGFVTNFTTPTANSSSSPTPPPNPPNKETIRSKLVDMMKQLRASTAAEYTFRKAEADLGTLKMSTPDFKQQDNEPLTSARAATTGVAASTTTTTTATASNATATNPNNKGKDLDLMALLAQVAVHHQLWDVAHAAVRAIHTDKTTSPAGQILADIVDAQLLVGCLSLQDAHHLLGHYVEIPQDVIATLALQEQGQSIDSNSTTLASSDINRPKIRTRRQSVATSMSVAFVPRRSSTGKALMQPSNFPYGKPIPQPTPSMVNTLLESRRLVAMKPLRRALIMARNYGNPYLSELAATVTWNIALPLLRPHTRTIIYPTLIAAAEALSTIDSPLVQLRVRLHLEIARAYHALDILPASSEHLNHALALDYGGLRADPHNGTRIAHVPLPSHAERKALLARKDFLKEDEHIIPDTKGTRELSTQRPLDRQLLPLAHTVALTGAVYNDPSDSLDQAALTLGQAKVATDPTVISTLLNKAALQIENGLELPKEATTAWKKLRSPSFAVTASSTAAVLVLPHDTSSPSSSSASTDPVTHPPPSTATASSRPSTTNPVNKLAPPPSLPPYPNGETSDPLPTARRKQGHRLYITLAELATQTKQWDLVLKAVYEIRSYGWDPINARDMVLLQAKADLLLSEAAVAKSLEYSEIMMEEKCREAALQASRQQEQRIQVAMERLKAGTPIPANMVNPVSVYPSSVSSSSTAIEESKKGMEDKPVRLRYWWDDDEDFGTELANDTLKDDPYKDIEVPEVTDEGFLYVPLAPLNESALALAASDTEPDRHPPRQYIPSEIGRKPGHKQIPSDAHALGLIVPGCPLALVAWKLRIISALVRCMRRGVALGAVWIVETAAVRLWNLHMHIWQTNDYGSAVLPPLIEALTDTVTCLLSINTTQTTLLGKIVFVIARYYEEEAKAALVNEALGIPANTNAYIGINGAVLVDYASLTPLPGILEGNLAVASPVTPDDRRIIYQRLVQLLSPSAFLIQSAEMTLNIVFQYISTVNLIPVARKDCIALRARLRLFTLAGHGISYLLNEPNGQPHVSPNRAALLEGITKSCTGDTTDPHAVDSVLVPVPSSLPTLPPSPTGTWSCPDYGLAVGLLQIMHHDDISFNDKVSALRLAIDTIPKCTEQLQNFIVDVCGPDPDAGFVAAHVHAQNQAQATDPKTGGRPPTQAAAKPGTAAATTKGGAAQTNASSASASTTSTDEFPMVHNVTKEAKASFQTATFTNPTVAANEAKRAELQKLHTTAMAELWARAAQAAVVLAKASMFETKTKNTVSAVSSPPSNALTPATSTPATPAKPTAGDPDLSLLTDAQRCAAEAIALVPMASALRIDELGSLFGLKGYDYDAYRLEIGPVYAKIANPVTEIVDVSIGRVNFRHRFGVGLDGSTIDGLGKGGFGNAFKWWSMAELAWGQAVGMLVNPERQNVIEQDALHRAALDHLSLASEWASRIRDTVLITATAFAIWNLAIPLALSKVTRPPLTQPLRRLLTAMNNSSTKEESHDAYLLRTELYVLLSQCHADATNWTNGLQVVEEAFATLPSIYHDRLWNHRLMFQSKLGQDVTQALMALKSKNPLLQARLWTSLARLAALPSDQGAAYVSALDTLQGMFTRAYVLLDYAEWLYSNHLPVSDVRDALHSAADTFLEIISPSVNENSGTEGTVGGGEGSTVGYSTQGSVIRGNGSVMGRRSSFMPSRRSVTGGGGNGSVAPTMAMRSSIAYSKPLPTMAGSQITGISGSLAGTSKLPTNDEPSDWPTKPEVAHYDALVRIFTHLALIAENGHERLNYLLMVVHYIKEAWLLTVHTLNRIHAEKMYFKMRESERAKISNYDQWLDDTTQNGTYKVPDDLAQWTVWWSQVTKYLPQAEERCKPVVVAVTTVTKGKSRPSSQAKPPTPSTVVPTVATTPATTDTVGSSSSAIPAEDLQPALDYVTMRQTITSLTAQHAVYVISRGSIRRPALTMYVLHWILDQLFAAGYHYHAAPVLAFMHTLSADLIDPPRARDPFTAVTLARTGVWADQINARDTSLAIFTDLSLKNKLTLNDTVRRIHEGEVVLLDVGKSKRNQDNGSGGGFSAQAAMVSALASKKLKAALKGGNMIGGLRNIARRIITNGEVRWAWTTLAQIAATRGMVRGARQLLLETWRHADAFVDWPLQWQAKITEAQLAAMEGDGKVAVDLIIEAVKETEGETSGTSMEIPAWEEVILLLGNILIKHHLYNDAKVALRASLEVFDQVTNPLIIEVPELSVKQLDLLNQHGGITKQIAMNKQNGTNNPNTNGINSNNNNNNAATKLNNTTTAGIFAGLDKPTPKPSKEINTDAAVTGVKIRLLLAHVYTLEAIRTRKVGGAWLPDWRIGDTLYAEAAEICRRYRLDTYGGLLSIALSSHAKAILACPGADLDGIPPISHDRQFTDVAESSEDMRNRFRATTPPRRARLLYLALACKLLHEASTACSGWYSSVALNGTVPSLTSPAHHLSCQIAADLAYADTLYTEEEISAALASERLIYAEVAANPVALYLHQAEQASNGVTSGVVQVIQATPSRASFILDATARALSTVSVHLPQEYGPALIAYGIGLYASMLSQAATVPFSTAPKDSSEALLASCGIVELDRQLWDIVRPSKTNVHEEPVVTAVPEPTVSRPHSATGKGGAPSKTAPSKNSVPVPAPAPPVSTRTEFVPFPTHPNDDSTASVRMITTIDPEITLPSTIVPSAVRSLHNQTIQTLTQGLSIAAATGIWNAVATAASYLVDCYGTLAPVRAALSLAMYQSCVTRNDLYSVFKTAAGLTSKQVLHIELVERMKNEYTHPEDLPIYTSALQYLNENSIVYRMMDCGRSIEDIFKYLPYGTRIVTVQRSVSGRVLYVAVLMKTKSVHPEDEVPGLTGTISRYSLSETERDELSNLCGDAQNIRTEYAGHVRAYSEGKGLAGEFVHPPSALMKENDNGPSNNSNNTNHTANDGTTNEHKEEMTHSASFTIKEDVCENRVNEIIERMKKLFTPILGKESSIGTWLDDTNGNSYNDPVILCVEKALTPLPFEALEIFAPVTTVTRDFSLQVLGHRLAISNYLRTQGSNAITHALPLSSSSALPCHARNSNITYVVDPRYEDTIDGRHGSPLGRLTVLDAFTALTGKPHQDPSGVPLNHPAPPGTANTSATHKTQQTHPTSDAHHDPVAEPSVLPSSSSSPSFYDLLHTSTPLKFTDEQGKLIGSTWYGFRGDSHVPAPAGWQELLRTTSLRLVTRTPENSLSTATGTETVPMTETAYAGGVTIFYGQGRLFAYLPPEAVAGLLCPGVRIAFLADTLSTNESARRQAILDNAKTAIEGRLELENTWETLALLTLSGIGTLIGQQWSLSHIAMETLVHGTLTTTIKQGIPIAKAVRSVFNSKKEGENNTMVTVKNRVKYATVVYGLPNTCIIGQE